MLSPTSISQHSGSIQPFLLVELSASLLKIIALAALIFAIIFGVKQWLYVAAALGILSLALYSYSAGANESWTDWMSRAIFSLKSSANIQNGRNNSHQHFFPHPHLTVKIPEDNDISFLETTPFTE